MRWPRALIAAAAVVFLTTLLRAHAQPPATPAAASADPAPDAAGYVGSPACQRCHAASFETWRRTLHVQMTRPIADARVLGDFTSGTRLDQYGRSYSMETRDGR